MALLNTSAAMIVAWNPQHFHLDRFRVLTHPGSPQSDSELVILWRRNLCLRCPNQGSSRRSETATFRPPEVCLNTAARLRGSGRLLVVQPPRAVPADEAFDGFIFSKAELVVFAGGVGVAGFGTLPELSHVSTRKQSAVFL